MTTLCDSPVTEDELSAFNIAFETDKMTPEQRQKIVIATISAFVMGYRAAKNAEVEKDREESRQKLAELIEYPRQWDIVSWPTLESAALEAVSQKKAEDKAFYTMQQMREYADGLISTRFYSVVDALETKIGEYAHHSISLSEKGHTASASVYTVVGEELRTVVDGIERLGSRKFQKRVAYWAKVCFGAHLAMDKRERNQRFIEEALELVQSCGMTRREAIGAVNYVFSRPVGEKRQEVGGVYTTLALLCDANGIDMIGEGERDYMSISTTEVTERIRAKRMNKPDFDSEINPMTRRQFIDSLHALSPDLFQSLTDFGQRLTSNGERMYDLVNHALRA
jgi:hypothetical protein